MAKITKLDPFISRTIWGGEKLSQLKSFATQESIGETWEVSSHPKGSSQIAGNFLSNICSLTYLTKFIDTSDNLSIQVHPGDDYAREVENDSGKMECWIVLEADKDAGIYLGFKEGVTKKEFFTALENKLDITKLLKFKKVEKGDFYVIPEGTIHAIGKGITLCEVQQSSGVTYRVWDWNRVDKNGQARELHVSKAKDVLNFSAHFNYSLEKQERKDIFSDEGIQELIKHRDFKVQLVNTVKKKKLDLTLNAKDSLTILNGSIGGDVELESFQSGIVLEGGQICLELEENTSFIIVSE